MNINEILETTPSKIALISEQAEDLRIEWQRTKETYTNKEAHFVMNLKTEYETIKTTEVKYYINADDDLYRQRLELLVLESKYRKKEVNINNLKEELNAAKMLARINMTEMQTIDWAGNRKGE